ncbi:hypothetical protein ACVWYH_000050 [Bradyrhizobium sp. GM24.11]
MPAGRWILFMTSQRPPPSNPEHRRRRDEGILAAIPDTSISGRWVARGLTALVNQRGTPGMIVSDNGTEFTCYAMLAWSEQNKVDWHFIGTPPSKTAL